MITDAQQIEHGAEVRGTIAIIGGGAAGITLALELASHFNDVLVLESGGFEFEPDTQSLYDGPVLNGTNTDLGSSRLRFLGGSTNHWGGQCAPLDEVDFERIADRPYSGWPFRLEELTPFYQRAYPYCELGIYRKIPAIMGRAELAAHQILDNPELEPTEFRHSPPTHFGERFRSDLACSNRLKVYLHANVSDISISSGGDAVSSVDVRTLTGRKFKVTADAFILSCGGIENARILLNCAHFFPNGIGNEHDLVGRFFMDHLGTGAGRIVPRNEFFDLGPFSYTLEGITLDGATRVTAALKNSAETVRRRGRGGCSLIMYPEFEDTELVSRAKESPAFQAFQELVRDMKRGQIPQGLGEHGCVVLDDPGTIITALYYRWSDSWRNKGRLKSIFVRMEGEQSPNRDSRVVLTNDVDALGMRKAGLDWLVTTEDCDNLYQTAMALARGAGAAAFGRMIVLADAQIDQSMINTNWHHMGTTRMHEDRRQGVVDRNCQLHGLSNFFIAGSSVFPTGGRVNPTLTIVALAIRLADHLKLEVKK